MLILRILFYIIGLLVTSLGVSLTIKADLGAGAWDALNVGLSTTVGFTVGTWVIIVGIILIIVNALLMKVRPEYLAVIPIFLMGPFIDFWLLIAFPNWEPEGFIYQLIILLLGLLGLSMGISIYLQAKFPLIPIDNFMVAIKSRLPINLGMAKTIGEITALLFAFLFKGPIGLGTIIVTFLIGPLIQVFFPRFENLLKRLSEKTSG
ncbi:membrane protein [Bacillus luteolus]|uniref:Membrane protein n=1 Tax=Litchfieldia luteola TaxID=682179 RepID=A0ABR9QQ10_9BACI|nr:membrane protein [Cytobacillus luteolus]MBE4910590.1 membrane protein [Cytobacillus luteolus]MBP1943767.1 putative membrane protein YczE [Cytobacillus luteolus]